ncbi:hypothetical protein DMENIID0001_085820 [Sergentomyia squamirostris]
MNANTLEVSEVEHVPFEMDKDVIFQGKLENAGRKVKIDEQHFWCVWRNEYLVGKVQNGEKVRFRIIDLTTMTFRVTRIPIDRKLLFENGCYTQLFYLHCDSILNLAIRDSGTGECLVFVEYNLNSYVTTFHPALPMSSRDFVRAMTLQNTIVRGNYFYFVRKMVFEIPKKTLHAEVYRYNLVKKGQFRCISTLPNMQDSPNSFMRITYDAIESDRLGIILFGVRNPRGQSSYSEQVALLDVSRYRWTLLPYRRNKKPSGRCATLEKTSIAPTGGDIFFIKRNVDLELWKRNMFTRETTKLAKITAYYVELVHCLEPNNILIVTRRNDQFFVLRKAQNSPPSLAQISADTVHRLQLYKRSNAELRGMGINRKFLNALLK